MKRLLLLSVSFLFLHWHCALDKFGPLLGLCDFGGRMGILA